jgi:hypothetical protein
MKFMECLEGCYIAVEDFICGSVLFTAIFASVEFSDDVCCCISVILKADGYSIWVSDNS